MTQLQNVAIGKVLTAMKTGKKPNVSKIMRESGYSPHSAKVPDVLTRSKAYRQIVEQNLPINEALAVHRDAYSATKWNDFTGEREKDHSVRLKAVDMTYKAHDLYGQNTEKYGNTLNQVNISWDSSGYSSSINKPNTKQLKRKA